MTKLALITGATGGIGSAIAKQLVEQGYTLILHGRDQHKLDALCHSLPAKHHTLIADISQPSQYLRLIEDAFQIGPVSLLVNNAGISHFSAFTSAQASDAKTAYLMQVNLLAPIALCQHFMAKVLPTHSATIINIGSALGSIGFPGFSLYCASKFGLRGFSESLSREYANSNIRIAYFGPRTTDTSINSSQVTDMNHALNSKVDSPEFVAQQFMLLLNSYKQRKIVGWPEKLFARINGMLPEVVDKAFTQKTKTIKQFAHLSTGDIK
ncbi:MAG: short-subunit dehydrogenase [Alphaproteobacteria bacterium]|jgi:short-subunit dehydrogenase